MKSVEEINFNEWYVRLSDWDKRYIISWNLLQFTWLKDKNWKEIYFDDILRYIDDYGEDQTWIVKDYGYFSGYVEAIWWDEEGNQDIQLHPNYENKREVIGNIYETPELLKD